MASKYYNPRLAANVAKAQAREFVDVGGSFSKGFEDARTTIEPLIKPAIDKYNADIETIASLAVDPKGIPVDSRKAVEEFVKQKKQEAFEARQSGVAPGAEAIQQSKFAIDGVAEVAKRQGARIAVGQELIAIGSSANDIETTTALKDILTAEFDPSDPDGNFYKLSNGEKVNEQYMDNVIKSYMVTPDGDYLDLYDKFDELVTKKFDANNQPYYGYDDVDAERARRMVSAKTDNPETGNTFTFDALSNPDPYRGLSKEFTDGIDFTKMTKSQIISTIKKEKGYKTDEEATTYAKTLVVNGFQKAFAKSFGKEKPYVDPLKAAKVKEIKRKGAESTAEIKLIEKEIDDAAKILNSKGTSFSRPLTISTERLPSKYEEELKDLGLSYEPIPETIINEDNKEIETGKTVGYRIFNTRLGKSKISEDILIGDSSSLIKKKMLDALGRKYKTVQRSYDVLKNDPFNPNN